MEDLSTMGTPTTWDAVGVGDEVVAWCALRERWVRGVVLERETGHVRARIEDYWFCDCDPVRLLSRASDPITTAEDLPRDTSAPDCAGLDDVAGLAEGVTRVVARAAAVTEEPYATMKREAEAHLGLGSPPRLILAVYERQTIGPDASIYYAETPQTGGMRLDGDSLREIVTETLARIGYDCALWPMDTPSPIHAEAHALRLAIREVCAMTEDEPDGDLAARLHSVIGLMKSWYKEAKDHAAAERGRADLAEQIKCEAIEQRDAMHAEWSASQLALGRIQEALRAATTLTTADAHPTAEAVRVALLRSVRA